MDKEDVRQTEEYYTVMKKKAIMPFAARQVGLGMITPREVRDRKTNII